MRVSKFDIPERLIGFPPMGLIGDENKFRPAVVN
jgi:hypothetical protein